MIATSDRFDGTYQDETAMVTAMIGRVALIAREKGWRGFSLADFSWNDQGDGAPIATIVIAPADAGEATVEDCRKMLKDKRRAAA